MSRLKKFSFLDRDGSDLPKEIRKLGMIELVSTNRRRNIYKLTNDKEYIIKEVKCYDDIDMLNRSIKEKLAISKLNKQMDSIVKMKDFQIYSENGFMTTYLIEEYYQPLSAYLQQKKKIKVREAISILKQLLVILMDCKKCGIYHLDIKIDNLFMKDDQLVLGDFGTSLEKSELKLNKERRGTLSCMAPEVFREGDCGELSEIYSIGIIAYQLFHQLKYPFVDDCFSHTEAIYRRLAGEKFTIHEDVLYIETVGAIVHKACQFNKERRYGDFNEMLHAFNELEKVSELLEVNLPEFGGYWSDQTTTLTEYSDYQIHSSLETLKEQIDDYSNELSEKLNSLDDVSVPFE